MRYIEWKAEYDIGIAIIDYQHRKLVNLINDLYDTNQKQDFKEDLLAIIMDELVKYTQYHFTTEENMMEKVNYINLPSHKDTHHHFVERINFLQSQLLEKKSDIGKDLFEFLRKWLLQHILKEDKDLVYHMRTGGGLV